MSRYELGDMVQLLGSPTKYLIHSKLDSTGNDVEYKLWEMGTDKYIWASDYQVAPVGRPIGFDLSDS